MKRLFAFLLIFPLAAILDLTVAAYLYKTWGWFIASAAGMRLPFSACFGFSVIVSFIFGIHLLTVKKEEVKPEDSLLQTAYTKAAGICLGATLSLLLTYAVGSVCGWIS